MTGNINADVEEYNIVSESKDEEIIHLADRNISTDEELINSLLDTNIKKEEHTNFILHNVGNDFMEYLNKKEFKAKELLYLIKFPISDELMRELRNMDDEEIIKDTIHLIMSLDV